jgi:hypothetical protein
MFDPADPFGTVDNIDAELTPDTGSAQFPVSFGEDAEGNLYIAYIASGEVYRIATGGAPVAGDYNGDGDVDVEDYDAWRTSYGVSSQPNFPPADGNQNGVVDTADYVIWRKAFGAGGAGSGEAHASIPEPASALLLVPLTAAVVTTRRRGRGLSPFA